ncbi:hypothetical protein FB45DRAFT_1050055 [Roridomyces roridus]|uniref:F-box domain-containing protein n=1 Tax=Roridomyces roridus TaxID=1738132 RepID=A0AAD7G0S2_9AGAR|nr:hypothetical protein FB45DRAFT_1050055 [Roridomyces roridus]
MAQEMSAKAIESQIEQISVEIERRKEAFMAEMRKLESSKSLLLQQLNAERDPIARLPLEIASEIFLHCLPPRSKDYPLYRRLQISIKGACDSLVASSILQHSAQLQSLCISFDETNAEEDDDDGCYEFLGGILPEMELPSLQELEIFGQAVDMPTNLLWPSVHRLLRLSLNLTELNIQNINFMTYLDEEIPQTFVLPHLGRLTHFHDFEVFNLSAPRLETLYVSAWALRDPSSPSSFRNGADPFDLHESMSLIPTLTHLESLFLGCGWVADLLNFLAQNPHITPNLQTFQMEEIYTDYDDNGRINILPPLAGILSARGGRLRKVRLTMTAGSIVETPPDDVAASFDSFWLTGWIYTLGPLEDPIFSRSNLVRGELADEEGSVRWH